MKTHPLNVSYLVIGLVFLGIAGSWALHEADVIGTAEVEWLLPLTLVAAGAIGLVAFATRGLSRSRAARGTSDQDPYTIHDDQQTYNYDGDTR
jgi:hypothetical protein